ncbi:hypothetical protein [Jannaschia sp. 2305UL9-9]|uniref:hypothetical protein n=1 Tax=Jannaschia sp. 2305UL9-9 TaxID=3121638 RepID=UPI0035274994
MKSAMAKNASNDVHVLRRLLARLPEYLKNAWQPVGSDRGFFGDGSSGENGIRSNSNLVFAIATLLSQKDEISVSEDVHVELGTILKRLVRYLTSSHVTGNGSCQDNGRWGLSWQSSWWATKLALGADMARDILEPDDMAAVHALVAAEANRHLSRLIPTGLSEDTKAEETAWDAEIIAVAMALLPDDSNAPLWRKRLIEFGINTFSCPSDRNNNTVVDGVTVSETLRSCNIHEDGSLENHGTTHFCYVASPLISKTWAAFALKRASIAIPDALAHNAKKVWEFSEPTFLSNRFAYLGGQDWARYTYGEYFILPALLFLASIECGERTGTIFQKRLALLDFEASRSLDGSFFGARFTQGLYKGQYAKYETDCFACIALTLTMLASQGFATGPAAEGCAAGTSSPESQCCYARNETAFMSFAWSTLNQPVPNLVFLPFSDDSIADWYRANLLGSIKFGQEVNWIGVKAMEAQGNSIRVEGSHSIRNSKGVALAQNHLKIDFRDGILRVASKYRSSRKLSAVHLTGLNWSIPNDVFNGFTRTYFFEGPSDTISSFESVASTDPQNTNTLSFTEKIKRKAQLHGEAKNFGASRWLNIDNKVGVVFDRDERIALRRYPNKEATWSSLNIERVETPKANWRFNVPKGSTLLDLSCRLHLGTARETQRLAQVSMN